MVYFDKAQVTVNGTGILADSVSIASTNALIPIYSLGKKGMGSQEPDGPIENQISLSYYLDLGREPIFPLLNTIKSITGIYSGITLSIANVTGLRCYLTKYQLVSTPNTLCKVNASFVSFHSLTGSLASRPLGIYPDADFSGRLAMGWTTHPISLTSYQTSPIYNLNYSFNAEWEPIYILGQGDPFEIQFLNGEEEIEIIKDTFKVVQLTGEELVQNSSSAAINTNGNDPLINLYGYKLISDNTLTSPTLNINISGAEILRSNITSEVDNYIRNTIIAKKYF